jgi:PAS domain-containing protein
MSRLDPRASTVAAPPSCGSLGSTWPGVAHRVPKPGSRMKLVLFHCQWKARRCKRPERVSRATDGDHAMATGNGAASRHTALHCASADDAESAAPGNQMAPRDRPVDAELYRLLVHSVKDYGIFMLDSNDHVASWNEGAERIKGYRAEEIIGRHLSTFYPAADIASPPVPRRYPARVTPSAPPPPRRSAWPPRRGLPAPTRRTGASAPPRAGRMPPRRWPLLRAPRAAGRRTPVS